MTPNTPSPQEKPTVAELISYLEGSNKGALTRMQADEAILSHLRASQAPAGKCETCGGIIGTYGDTDPEDVCRCAAPQAEATIRIESNPHEVDPAIQRWIDEPAAREVVNYETDPCVRLCSRENLDAFLARYWPEYADHTRLLAAEREKFQPFFDFHAKHGLPPKAKPSCLVCGKTAERPYAIRHAELPHIVVCQACRDSASERDQLQQEVAGLRFERGAAIRAGEEVDRQLRAAEQRVAGARELLEMLKRAAINMRGEDFNLSSAEWALVHAWLSPAKGDGNG
jgi:hypothetical protein